MNALRVVRSLGPIDAKNVGRDALLRWMAVLPLLLAATVRFVLPVMVERIEHGLGVEIMPYYAPPMGVALLLTTPVLVGMVVGFLLLDQRDDRTLLALRVTPLPLGGYLAYRLAMPLVLSVVFTVVAFPLAGLMELNLGELLLAAGAAALLAPLLALALAAFAANKVQGFALVKGGGVLLIAPLIAYFVPLPWQLAFGLAPTYWPSMLFWSLGVGSAESWAYLVVGTGYHALLIGWLLRRFGRLVLH